jgi:predicted dinucleotide-binding enzyme
MHIGIIGAGNVGVALGAGWLRAGHTVTFGVRNPATAKTTVTGFAFNLVRG